MDEKSHNKKIPCNNLDNFFSYFLVLHLLISLTHYEYASEQVYSESPTSTSNDPSCIGGAWQSQLLSPQPEAGSMNVSRDTAIWIDEPRPCCQGSPAVSYPKNPHSHRCLVKKRWEKIFLPKKSPAENLAIFLRQAIKNTFLCLEYVNCCYMDECADFCPRRFWGKKHFTSG